MRISKNLINLDKFEDVLFIMFFIIVFIIVGIMQFIDSKKIILDSGTISIRYIFKSSNKIDEVYFIKDIKKVKVKKYRNERPQSNIYTIDNNLVFYNNADVEVLRLDVQGLGIPVQQFIEYIIFYNKQVILDSSIYDYSKISKKEKRFLLHTIIYFFLLMYVIYKVLLFLDFILVIK